jgi:hypothetical protein
MSVRAGALAVLVAVVIVLVAGCSTVTRGPSRSLQQQTPTTVSVGMGSVSSTSSTTSCGTPPSVGTLPTDQQTDITVDGKILHYVPPGPLTYNCGVHSTPGPTEGSDVTATTTTTAIPTTTMYP